MYIDEAIGEEYLKWKNGDTIYLTAPTGRGKSTFILNVLLKKVIKEGGRLLYLVNRTILKEQIMADIDAKDTQEFWRDIPSNMRRRMRDYIEVMTYQSIEESLQCGRHKDIIDYLNKFTYAVYDEVHYFYSDSTYNTFTELSYDCLRRVFDFKVQIFLSATMENVKKVMDMRTALYTFGESEIPYISGRTDVYGNIMDRRKLFGKPYTYTSAIDYDYINIKTFEEIDDLIGVIESNIYTTGEKWLIFTDSIDKGKDLCEKILQRIKEQTDQSKEEEVVFIDATYKDDEERKEYVSKVAEEKYIDKQVVITTAVMDNGISFHDNELRNLVILADTKEMFLQMLGRKREDGEIVQVYICRRNVAYFRRRLDDAKRVVHYYNDKLYNLENAWFERIDYNYNKPVYPCTICFSQKNIFSNSFWQQSVMQDLLKNTVLASYIRRLCYCLNGIFSVNTFAINKFKHLRDFYTRIHNEIQNDPDAFVKEQLRWLGGIDITQVTSADKEIAEIYARDIKNALEEILGDEEKCVISKKQNIQLKLSNSRAFLFFIAPEKKENFKKKDRAISKADFAECMKKTGLPYELLDCKGKSNPELKGSYILKKY